MKTLDDLHSDPLLATEVHKLEARLWRKTRRNRIQVVVVTSATRGEGKSTTVAYLSTALGCHSDRKILAVDLDLRQPKLATHFQIPAAVGMSDVLAGRCAVSQAITRTELPALDLLLQPSTSGGPDLLFRTARLAEIVGYFRSHYDLTLLDVPALLPVADATTVLPLADGVILMAMSGKTTLPQLRRAREICLGMESKILGLIIGNLQEAVPEYGYYGDRYGYESEERREKDQQPVRDQEPVPEQQPVPDQQPVPEQQPVGDRQRVPEQLPVPDQPGVPERQRVPERQPVDLTAGGKSGDLGRPAGP